MDDLESGGASATSSSQPSLIPSGPPIDLSPLLSEDAVYKLGLLDYRTGYCLPQDAKPFSRHFFACAPPNASSFQFNAFASITTWLLQMNKRSTNPNAAGEDPATFISRLLGELRALGWGESVDRDLPLMKLRLGAGEPVCRVLLFLADKALNLRGFSPVLPDFLSGGGGGRDPNNEVPEEIVDDNDAADDDAAALIDGASSSAAGSTKQHRSKSSSGGGGGGESKNNNDDDNVVVEEEEEVVLFSESAWGGPNSKSSSSSSNHGRLDGIIGGSSLINRSNSLSESKLNNVDGGGGGKESDFSTLRADLASDKKLTAMIEPTVNAQVWRAEVDRVAPKLAAATPSGLISGSSKGGVGGVQKGEWRAHLEQSTHSNAIVASLLPTSKGSLERLSEDLTQLLEVVRGREKSINTSFKHLMVEHKACAEKTTESQLAVQAVQATVNKFSTELAAISDVLEDVKQNIEEKGNSVTDTSPLIKVKAALSSIRSECRSLDLQIGVVSYAVLQARITHKRILSSDDDAGLNVN